MPMDFYTNICGIRGFPRVVHVFGKEKCTMVQGGGHMHTTWNWKWPYAYLVTTAVICPKLTNTGFSGELSTIRVDKV